MKSIRTDPRNHAAEGDERIRTAVCAPSDDPAYDAQCPCGCGPRATLHERGFTVASLPDEEALRALDKIEALVRRSEWDARLLDGRDHRQRRFTEAYRLIRVLRARAEDDRG